MQPHNAGARERKRILLFCHSPVLPPGAWGIARLCAFLWGETPKTPGQLSDAAESEAALAGAWLTSGAANAGGGPRGGAPRREGAWHRGARG